MISAWLIRSFIPQIRHQNYPFPSWSTHILIPRVIKYTPSLNFGPSVGYITLTAKMGGHLQMSNRHCFRSSILWICNISFPFVNIKFSSNYRKSMETYPIEQLQMSCDHYMSSLCHFCQEKVLMWQRQWLWTWSHLIPTQPACSPVRGNIHFETLSFVNNLIAWFFFKYWVKNMTIDKCYYFVVLSTNFNILLLIYSMHNLCYTKCMYPYNLIKIYGWAKNSP